MNKVKIKYSQTCDFCKKEVETDKDGLPEIWLPGYLIEMGGKVVKQYIHAYICSDCMGRLRHKLEDFLDVKERAYFGNAIQWKEDVHG